MPELPEAETIARDLHPRLADATIRDVRVVHADILAEGSSSFADRLRDRTFQGVGRRGKNVVLRLRDGGRLVVNLGMTGRLVMSDSPRADQLNHIAVQFGLDDGRSLLYDDTRRFGLLSLHEPDAWVRRDSELGIEPLSSDFTTESLWSLTRRSRTPIRNLLLDQNRVAGIGNIYALEALFRAGVRPTRRAHRVTRKEAARLRDAIVDVLEDAIRHRGTTFSDYRDGSGETGAFQPLLKVYGREGDPCTTCSTPIKRKTLTNRGAFYCPACQA